jgi:cellulose synthase/poly-beta-1,6-N-acetylglucosamine synthase-like glycosyltransferase
MQIDYVPRVSVIIPLYNKAAYIGRSVESVLQQDWPDMEVIVVNDGSTDGGEENVRQINDTRLRLINQPNRGPGAARNTGIRAAQSPTLAFLDADDEWLPGYLTSGLSALSQYPEVAAVTQGHFTSRPLVSTQPLWEARGIREGLQCLEGTTVPQYAVNLLAYVSPWSTIARREAILAYNGFYEKTRCLYAEDAYLWLQILLNHPIVTLLKPRVIYHTEASELAAPLTRPHPVEPFLLDPTPIEQACPADKRALLQHILAIRAADTARLYALHGQGGVSRDLIKRFAIPGFMTWQTVKLKALAQCAPILPRARAIYRQFKHRTR